MLYLHVIRSLFYNFHFNLYKYIIIRRTNNRLVCGNFHTINYNPVIIICLRYQIDLSRFACEMSNHNVRNFSISSCFSSFKRKWKFLAVQMFNTKIKTAKPKTLDIFVYLHSAFFLKRKCSCLGSFTCYVF